MIEGWSAVYWREMLILRRRIFKLIPAWSVSPFLYLVAFGYVIGRHVEVGGHNYMEFLIPGLAGMASMTQSFAIAGEINIARFYWHIFEEFQSAPISSVAYVLGEVLAGMTRAVLAGSVILVLGAAFGVVLSYNIYFWLAFLLNSLVFAALAVGLAMVVKSHADQALMNSFIITPMAFLGGTLFPLDQLPRWAQHVLGLLPLTHATRAIRAASFGGVPESSAYGLLAVTGCACMAFAVFCVQRAGE